eukprot:3519193-Rhodomonas_salina.1
MIYRARYADQLTVQTARMVLLPGAAVPVRPAAPGLLLYLPTRTIRDARHLILFMLLPACHAAYDAACPLLLSAPPPRGRPAPLLPSPCIRVLSHMRMKSQLSITCCDTCGAMRVLCVVLRGACDTVRRSSNCVIPCRDDLCATTCNT